MMLWRSFDFSALARMLDSLARKPQTNAAEKQQPTTKPKPSA